MTQEYRKFENNAFIIRKKSELDTSSACPICKELKNTSFSIHKEGSIELNKKSERAANKILVKRRDRAATRAAYLRRDAFDFKKIITLSNCRFLKVKKRLEKLNKRYLEMSKELDDKEKVPRLKNPDGSLAPRVREDYINIVRERRILDDKSDHLTNIMPQVHRALIKNKKALRNIRKAIEMLESAAVNAQEDLSYKKDILSV